MEILSRPAISLIVLLVITLILQTSCSSSSSSGPSQWKKERRRQRKLAAQSNEESSSSESSDSSSSSSQQSFDSSKWKNEQRRQQKLAAKSSETSSSISSQQEQQSRKKLFRSQPHKAGNSRGDLGSREIQREIEHADEDIKLNDEGERELHSQVAGNEDIDFLEYKLLEKYEPVSTSTEISGKKAHKASPGRGKGGKSTCVFDKANSIPCDETTLFREPTGRCNNLQHKTWGMAGTAYLRALPARYEDGIDVEQRTSQNGEVLPNPRLVSLGVSVTAVHLDAMGFSNEIMQWGQFISHEITAISERERDTACCADTIFKARNAGVAPTKLQLKEYQDKIEKVRGDICIQIDLMDPVYGRDVCMNQVRSFPTINDDCIPGPREQMNTATHFVDGSVIYGSSTASMQRLRKFTGGKLASQFINGEELLPVNRDRECPAAHKCPFDAGDRRVNTTPNLVAIQTMFLRLHNKLAERLARINSHWDDERLYQEARRIVIAIQQNIHYNEWLQHLMDTATLEKYELRKSKSSSFLEVYDEELHPALLNELATAALRMGHGMVGGMFSVKDEFRPLTPNFNNPAMIYDEGITPCVEGLVHDRPWKLDNAFASAMRNKLFGKDMDIITLNINRGRDHGLPTYAELREHYKFDSIHEWSDFSKTHEPDVVARLKSVYANPRDVELYIAGVTEKPSSHDFMGPLFMEIFGDAFRRLRNGDRFYFEGEQSGFDKKQMNSIRDYTYSKLICQTTDINSMPLDAFKRPSDKNPLKDCEKIDDVKIENLWEER